MNNRQNFFLKRITLPALLAGTAALLASGCASTSAPAPAPTPMAPAYLPPVGLTEEQLTKLRQESPDTCNRVQAAQPLTLADVKVMAKIGLTPEVINNQVRISRTVFHLTASSIIDLKNAGVSDQVINFLISTPNSIAGSAPVPEPSTNAAGAQTPPPAPIAETQPPSPGPDYVWVDGDWVWNNGWVWAGGYWVIPPWPGALWYHGGWVRGWGGIGPYHRFRGHWR